MLGRQVNYHVKYAKLNVVLFFILHLSIECGYHCPNLVTVVQNGCRASWSLCNCCDNQWFSTSTVRVLSEINTYFHIPYDSSLKCSIQYLQDFSQTTWHINDYARSVKTIFHSPFLLPLRLHTVQCHFNMVNFISNPHNRHPIHWWGDFCL